MGRRRTDLDTLRGSNLEHPFWIRQLRKKEVRAMRAVGRVAKLHGGGVTIVTGMEIWWLGTHQEGSRRGRR
jgi:hypothetical protein